jgi:hypothetical protein
MHEPQIREVLFAPTLLGNHMMDVKFLAIFQVLVANWELGRCLAAFGQAVGDATRSPEA